MALCSRITTKDDGATPFPAQSGARGARACFVARLSAGRRVLPGRTPALWSIALGALGFTRGIGADRANHGSSSSGVPLHGQRTAHYAGAVLHDAQPHSMIIHWFAGETDAVVLHPEDDSIVLGEEMDHNKLGLAVP